MTCFRENGETKGVPMGNHGPLILSHRVWLHFQKSFERKVTWSHRQVTSFPLAWTVPQLVWRMASHLKAGGYPPWYMTNALWMSYQFQLYLNFSLCYLTVPPVIQLRGHSKRIDWSCGPMGSKISREKSWERKAEGLKFRFAHAKPCYTLMDRSGYAAVCNVHLPSSATGIPCFSDCNAGLKVNWWHWNTPVPPLFLQVSISRIYILWHQNHHRTWAMASVSN